MTAKKIIISCFILIFILGMMSACGLDEDFEENLENKEQLKEEDEEEKEEEKADSKEVDNEKEPEDNNNEELETIIEEEKYFIYTIQKGDTIFEIAMENNTTVDTLLDLNDLKNKSLYPDQELKIPEVN